MSEKPRHTFPVSWDELHRDSRALAWRLLEKGPWTGIVAITTLPARSITETESLP